jgi:PEP-CTERM motif
LPNGYSSSPTDPGTLLYDSTEAFDFDSGLLSGTLRQRVIQYSDVVDPGHPYGSGLYIDYEITLTSGDVTEFIVSDYSGLAVSVKECGIPGCGGSGANSVSTTSASRSSDGSDISFLFDGDLSGTAHSANLQLLTNATNFVDPFGTFVTSDGDMFPIAVLTLSIPEPSTWAMMLLGFVGLGFVGFRQARPWASIG